MIYNYAQKVMQLGLREQIIIGIRVYLVCPFNAERLMKTSHSEPFEN
jgi:hypothetical protein